MTTITAINSRKLFGGKAKAALNTAHYDPILSELITAFMQVPESIGKESHTFLFAENLLLVYTSDIRTKVDEGKIDYLPNRGAAVTALRVHAGRQILDPAGIPHDLVSAGKPVSLWRDQLPIQLTDEGLVEDSGFQKRAMIVRALRPLPFKCVGRILDRSQSAEPRISFLRADVQHLGVPVSSDAVRREHPTLEKEFRKLFGAIESHAETRGQVVKDLTCRAAYTPDDPEQIVWCEKVGVRARFFPKGRDEDGSHILEPLYDEFRRGKTARRVEYPFKLRTGRSLREYQQDELGIVV